MTTTTQLPNEHASSKKSGDEASPAPNRSIKTTSMFNSGDHVPSSIAKRKRSSLSDTEDDAPHTAKRDQTAFHASSDSSLAESSTITKRQRLSSARISFIKKPKEDRKRALATPPITPPELAVRTTRLTVTIPQQVLTKEEQRTLKLRRAAAERWQQQDKLQRPPPEKKEMTQAYNLKLLRHYTDPIAQSVPNFSKPHIDRSERVDKLRNEFPLQSTKAVVKNGAPQTPLTTAAEISEIDKHKMLLRENKNITRSEYAQRLAWESFSSREQDRIDRGREAMMESGLWEDDLRREEQGQDNLLPEWRQVNTGKFAKEQLEGDSC
ncbi:hypothetical protein N0V83_000887 [Neocucurbitaria cava]|uniref:Uncharacterized protein n=1 Tax=Neocucurbitaria cava TaxID=798079 RepID=A0A9W8YHJ9_9PLEO|nr:hypothetical protein N0V83_000887 [Neocucurbitaria cava]